jgi:hypothetical protein
VREESLVAILNLLWLFGLFKFSNLSFINYGILYLSRNVLFMENFP